MPAPYNKAKTLVKLNVARSAALQLVAALDTLDNLRLEIDNNVWNVDTVPGPELEEAGYTDMSSGVANDLLQGVKQYRDQYRAEIMRHLG